MFNNFYFFFYFYKFFLENISFFIKNFINYINNNNFFFEKNSPLKKHYFRGSFKQIKYSNVSAFYKNIFLFNIKRGVLNKNPNKFIKLLNQKVYFFKFFNDSDFFLSKSNYFYFYIFYLNNQNLINRDLIGKNFNKNSFSFNLILKNFNKNLKYKMKKEQLSFLKLNFFLKTQKNLTLFLQKNKNISWSYFLVNSSFFLKNFLINIGLSNNLKKINTYIKKNLIYINGCLTVDENYYLRQNDILSFNFTNFNKILLKNILFFNKIYIEASAKKVNKNVLNNSNFYGNFEFFLPSMSFVFINFFFWKNLNFLIYLNLTNIRSYSWSFF